jgi:hypothetical protein
MINSRLRSNNRTIVTRRAGNNNSDIRTSGARVYPKGRACKAAVERGSADNVARDHGRFAPEG